MCKLLWFIRSRRHGDLNCLSAALCGGSAPQRASLIYPDWPNRIWHLWVLHHVFHYCGKWWKHPWQGTRDDMIYAILEWGWSRVSWRRRELGPHEPLGKVVKKLQALTVAFVDRQVLYVCLFNSPSWYLSESVSDSWEQGWKKIHCSSLANGLAIGSILWARWRFKCGYSLLPLDWCIAQPDCVPSLIGAHSFSCSWHQDTFITFTVNSLKRSSHYFSGARASVYQRSPLKTPSFGLVEEEQLTGMILAFVFKTLSSCSL